MDLDLQLLLEEIVHKESKAIDEGELSRFLFARSIERVFHFTSLRNLPSLMQNGFLGREEMSSRGIEYQITDGQRNEPLPDAICFSLSRPNQYMMLNKIKLGQDLILISIKHPIQLFFNKKFLCSPGNFGRRDIKDYFINWPEKFVGGQGLVNMFLNPELRERYSLDENEPTDARSEIMMFDPIPWQNIEAIYAPAGREYASQDQIRLLTKTLPRGIEFRSQNNLLFNDIEWKNTSVQEEYRLRTWSSSWS